MFRVLGRMVPRGAFARSAAVLAIASVAVVAPSTVHADQNETSVGSANASFQGSITAANMHSCAVTSTGAAKCWGYNAYGQLGNNTQTNSNIPVDVSGLSSEVTAITAGDYHTCALLSTGGVKCWGYGQDGELGDGTTTLRSSVPVDVSGLSSGVTAIAAGAYHTCALLSSGGVKCWGMNPYGQLGNNTQTNSNIPVDVSGLSSEVAAITAGGEHSCALLSTGGVTCWGDNHKGELGDGTTTDSRTPVTVSGLTSPVTAITAGGEHTCALLSSGGVMCWGYNVFGGLGDGTTIDRPAPVNVTGLTSGVTAISAGGSHTCALLSTGAATCWGYNHVGELGDGTTTHSRTPVTVSGLTSPVTAITTGSSHSCALLSSGGMKCWGHNSRGGLGDNSTTERHTPVDVFGLTSGVGATTTTTTTLAPSTTTTSFAPNLPATGSNSAGRVVPLMMLMLLGTSILLLRRRLPHN